MRLIPLLILASLATYRMTRLITTDKIAERLRDWTQTRSEFIAYLGRCDWCLSIWLAPFPSLGLLLWPTNRAILAAVIALAASTLTGILAGAVDRLEDPTTRG